MEGAATNIRLCRQQTTVMIMWRQEEEAGMSSLKRSSSFVHCFKLNTLLDQVVSYMNVGFSFVYNRMAVQGCSVRTSMYGVV